MTRGGTNYSGFSVILSITSEHIVEGCTYVAVPCRNRRLFDRIFQLHFCIPNAILLNFH